MPGAVAIVALDLASPPVTVIPIPIDETTTTSQVSTTATTPPTTTVTPPTTTVTPPTTATPTATTTPTTTATTVEVASDDGAIYVVTWAVLAAVLLVAVILLLRSRDGRKRQAAEPEDGPTLTERVRELSEQAMMESAPDGMDEAAIAELYPWISTEEGIIIDLGDEDALTSPDRNHDSQGREEPS